MQTLEGIRRQIDSVEGLQSIVRTMKTLAAANVRNFETAARSVGSYARTVELGFRALLHEHPLSRVRSDPDRRDPAAVVVLGTDQGLCGAFNERVAAHVAERLASETRAPGPVLAVGGRVRERLVHGGLAPDEALSVPTSLAGVTSLVEEILLRVDAWRREGRLERLIVFHNRRLSGAGFRTRTVRVLPVPDDWLQRLERERWPERGLPTFSMGWRPLLSALTREFLFVSVFRAVVESLESENASRLGAMQAAERNIEERLEELGNEFRDLRQSSITAELLDIVAGYEATGFPEEDDETPTS